MMADATKLVGHFVCPVCGELMPTTQSEFPVLRDDWPVYQRLFVEHSSLAGRPCPMSGEVAFPLPFSVQVAEIGKTNGGDSNENHVSGY